MRTSVIASTLLTVLTNSVIRGEDGGGTQPRVDETQLKSAVAAIEAIDGRLVQTEGIPRFELLFTADDESLNLLPNPPFYFELELKNAQITDAGIRKIATLKHLAGLNLEGTKITDAGMAEIAKLKSLTHLGAEWHEYNGCRPQGNCRA